MRMGLGDAVKDWASALGIKPCNPCKKRRKILNKLVPFDKMITVEVNTDMYKGIFPRGSVITIDKNHRLYSIAAKLIDQGHLKVMSIVDMK